MSRGHVCPNCKEYNKDGHYVPPCLGDKGFYVCEWKEHGPPPLSKRVEVMPGVIRTIKLCLPLLLLACSSPTAPVQARRGPGCTLRARIAFGTVNGHYAICPAPQFVDTWTVHYANGDVQVYAVEWDA